MRSVFDMGHSHFDTGGPSPEHNENFSERRKGQVQLEFGQFFNDLHDLNRLWTVRDIGGQTTPLPLVVRIFFVRRDFAADTRKFATTATDFRASGTRICALLEMPLVYEVAQTPSQTW